MKSSSLLLLIICLLFVVDTALAQPLFPQLLEDVQTVELPYASRNSKALWEKRKVLTLADRDALLEHLKTTKPRIVNSAISSAFGELDCKDPADCEALRKVGEVAVLGIIPFNQERFLLHLRIKPETKYSPSTGMLLCLASNGEIADWMLVTGRATGGNPNGDVSRSFTIDSDFNITIHETSWGTNNLNFSVEAAYTIFTEVPAKIEEEAGSGFVKMEHLELKTGSFELQRFCLDL